VRCELNGERSYERLVGLVVPPGRNRQIHPRTIANRIRASPSGARFAIVVRRGMAGFVTATVARLGSRVRWRMTISFARHQFPPEIIRHAVWLYVRFTLSYRDVEDLLAERGQRRRGISMRWLW
jgi:hypothetical protein